MGKFVIAIFVGDPFPVQKPRINVLKCIITFSNFLPGVFLLYYHHTEAEEVKSKQMLYNTKLDGSHAAVFFAWLISGILICGFTIQILTFYQLTLSAVTILYAIALVVTGKE